MNESVVFNAAVKLPKDQRAAFLEAACNGNPRLRAEVEGLLREHDGAGGFMDRPAAQPPATTDSSSMHRPGAIIAGRFKLLEQIGEGGMGAVWVAEQTEPVRRRVALKLIKPGMDTKQVLSRFAAERQALALMDHPNIAKVYDGGMTEEGRPFFVMEYVKGVPITDYCDQAKLPIEERLKLFLPICQAVQHAHQKGIIHRDLKPSNLLVCLYDGQPVPKVIDFGLAKAISQPLTEHTLYTAHGLMVGTPMYMSPEQAEFNNLDVDTRTDIYSLGVILYELLTGTTPLEKKKFKDAAFQEILRLIKEEEPPKPSTKLSGSASLPAIAAQRGLEPAQLSRVVRGELDWIVMKSLEKERSRRYETANGLTRDLERYLHDEPVEACPPSLSYKVSKFTRRNMRSLVTASLFGVVVLAALLTVAGSIGYVWSYLGTRQAVVERKIERALDKAQEAYGRGDLKEAAAAATQAEGLLASADISPELTRKVTQWQADLAMVERLEKIHLEKASAIKEDHFDPTSAAVPYSKAFSDYGLNFSQLGPLDAAQRLQKSAIKSHLAAALDDWAFHSDQAQQRRLVAISRQADPDPWRNRLRDAVEKNDADELSILAAEESCLQQPAVTLAFLAARLHQLGKRQPSLTLLRQANLRYSDDFWINEYLGNQLLLMSQADEAAIYLRLATNRFSNSPAARNALGVALAFGGKTTEALDEYRAAIRLKPDFAMPHYNLGSALETLNKPAEAEAAYREAHRLRTNDASVVAGLADFLAGQNKNQEAERLYLSALALAPRDWLINFGYINLLDKSGRLAAVEAECKRRLKEQPNKPLLNCLLGDLAAQRQSFSEAEAAYRAAIKLDEKDAVTHTKLGMILAEQSKFKEAEEACRTAINLEPNSTWAQFKLGMLLNSQQRYAEAEVHLRKAIELTPNLTYAYTALSSALRSQNKSLADVRRPTLTLGTVSLSPGASGRPTSRPSSHLKGQFELGVIDMGVAAYSVVRGLSMSRSTFGGSFGSRPPTGSRGGTTRPPFTNPQAEEAQLRDAIARNPKDWAAREQLCALLIQQNSSRAFSAIWEAISADPTNAKFHAYMGAAFGGSRNYAEAALRESIRLKADDPYAHRLLARALTSQGRHAEAVASARQAIRLEPANKENHSMLAWCLVRHGDLPGAEAAYREALKDPRSFTWNDRVDLFCVLRQMGKTQEADAEYANVMRLGQFPTRANNEYGNDYFSETCAYYGKLAWSLYFYDAALRENPADSAAAMRAGLIRLLQGDRQGYEKHCQQLLEQTAKDTSATNARRTVQVCLITPQVIGDLSVHAKREEAFNVPATGYNLFLILRERALLAYRRGQWDDAVRLARESRAELDKPSAATPPATSLPATPSPANEESSSAISTEQFRLYHAQNLIVEAMSLFGAGKSAAARQAYMAAGRLKSQAYPFAPESLGRAWVDWIIYEILRREAQALLNIEDNIDWREHVARGRAAAAAGDWKTAAAEFNRACESPAADSIYWIGAATATVRTGDADLYRRHCQAMIERFKDTENWNEIERTLKNCSLAAGIEVPSEMVAFVSKGIDDGSAPPGLVPWANVGRAMVAYRQRDWDHALEWSDLATNDRNATALARALALVASALANHGKGDTATAKEKLAEAVRLHEAQPVPRRADGTVDERLLLMEYTGWYDWMNVELLRREAVALLEMKNSPKGNAESSPSSAN